MACLTEIHGTPNYQSMAQIYGPCRQSLPLQSKLGRLHRNLRPAVACLKPQHQHGQCLSMVRCISLREDPFLSFTDDYCFRNFYTAGKEPVVVEEKHAGKYDGKTKIFCHDCNYIPNVCIQFLIFNTTAENRIKSISEIARSTSL